MALFSTKTPWQRAWQEMLRREARLARRAEARREPWLNRALEGRVPAGVREKLDAAFVKAFQLVFDKGTGVIERSCGKQRRQAQFLACRILLEEQGDSRAALAAFPRAARSAGRGNLLLSGAEGVGLGLLGIGLPDIPVFTAVLLKSLYETAMSFGFPYDTPGERRLILRLIRTALSSGEDYRRGCRDIDGFFRRGEWEEAAPMEEEIRAAAGALSGAILYAKFLQGVPLVGAAGGVYDAVFLGRVTQLARVKYQRRFLLEHRPRSGGAS